MKAIEASVLDAVAEEARRSPRLRKNHNLHGSDQSACHRLFNAIEPDSYIRPHRHLNPDKDETFVLIRGKLGVVSFDREGKVTGTALLEPAGAVAADIPHGEFHGAVSLAPGTIFFEAKAGPYLPLSPEEVGTFAPAEGTPEAAAYLEALRALFSR
ncbi:WbuC family cupin fold metalloprotein [Geomonas sp. Red32]|uniref:WbuC family cupin fold metalloprotein n=1 Tax=Geomonas sp. Red32 TaxID=2912856 RepID=UPI00202CBAB1|nr:WbuC family cupin fold metalloprotein [Geomonas sp. Red32]MCM0081312.1 WbuC family cupin fold metalloprotein [Geomonas sp. Red32]